MTTTRSAPYSLVPVSSVLGAEVVGIDLANGVDEASAGALRDDFWRSCWRMHRRLTTPSDSVGNRAISSSGTIRRPGTSP